MLLIFVLCKVGGHAIHAHRIIAPSIHDIIAQVFYHQPTPRFGVGQSQHTVDAESLGIARRLYPISQSYSLPKADHMIIQLITGNGVGLSNWVGCVRIFSNPVKEGSLSMVEGQCLLHHLHFYRFLLGSTFAWLLPFWLKVKIFLAGY